MKSQIQKQKQNKKAKKEWWNCGITNTNIFPKKSFSWGDKNFFGQKNNGEVVDRKKIGELMIRSWQGLGGVS